LFKVNVSDTVKVSARTSWKKTSEYFENQPWRFVLAAGLTLAGSIVGLLVAGPIGILLGLILGAASLFISWREKVREIERGGDKMKQLDPG
jgi:hypothetical protein